MNEAGEMMVIVVPTCQDAAVLVEPCALAVADAMRIAVRMDFAPWMAGWRGAVKIARGDQVNSARKRTA